MGKIDSGLVEFFWRATLFGALAGGVIGFIGGIVVAVIGKPELGSTVGGFAGYIVSVPVTMCAIKKILNKQFNGYSVCLVKKGATETE